MISSFLMISATPMNTSVVYTGDFHKDSCMALQWRLDPKGLWLKGSTELRPDGAEACARSYHSLAGVAQRQNLGLAQVMPRTFQPYGHHFLANNHRTLNFYIHKLFPGIGKGKNCCKINHYPHITSSENIQ